MPDAVPPPTPISTGRGMSSNPFSLPLMPASSEPSAISHSVSERIIIQICSWILKPGHKTRYAESDCKYDTSTVHGHCNENNTIIIIIIALNSQSDRDVKKEKQTEND